MSEPDDVEAALARLQTAVDFFAIEAIAPGNIRADLALIRHRLATVPALVAAERERCAQIADDNRSALVDVGYAIRQGPAR